MLLTVIIYQLNNYVEKITYTFYFSCIEFSLSLYALSMPEQCLKLIKLWSILFRTTVHLKSLHCLVLQVIGLQWYDNILKHCSSSAFSKLYRVGGSEVYCNPSHSPQALTQVLNWCNYVVRCRHPHNTISERIDLGGHSITYLFSTYINW